MSLELLSVTLPFACLPNLFYPMMLAAMLVHPSYVDIVKFPVFSAVCNYICVRYRDESGSSDGYNTNKYFVFCNKALSPDAD